jgi:hypothetical protein
MRRRRVTCADDTGTFHGVMHSIAAGSGRKDGDLVNKHGVGVRGRAGG